MPPSRPSAFEVSFPDEVDPAPLSSRNDATFGGQKRGAEELHNTRPGKRPAVEKALFYKSTKADCPEDDALIVNMDFDDEADHGSKPVRVLTDFTIFDPGHGMELVSLHLLETHDGVPDRQFEAAGFARPFSNDEDEGQEDGLDDELQVHRIRLGAILICTVDPLQQDDPVWIETMHAWYRLDTPSRLYQPLFLDFYRPHRAAQLVIAFARDHQDEPLASLQRYMHDLHDGFNWTDADILSATSLIEGALEDRDDLKSSPIMTKLFHGIDSHTASSSHRRSAGKRRAPVILAVPSQPSTGNLDLAALRVRNPTTVTPFIASLATGLFREQLRVIGKPLESVGLVNHRKFDRLHLRRLLQKTHTDSDHNVRHDKRHRLKPRSQYLKSVFVGDDMYSVSDVVVVPIGHNDETAPPELPPPDRIPSEAEISDYFWFAKIIYIDPEHGTAHVQWFEHSARTVMEEVSDSHELFMTEICDMVDLSTIVGKVTVHSWVNKSGRPPLKAEEYYYRFHYDTHTACFRDPDSRHMALADDPPNNCPVCPLLAQRDRDEHGRQIHNGVSLHGIDYHVNDFVLYMSDHGPAHVGHILSVQHPRRPHRDSTILVTVQALGRVTSISSYPATKYRNERELFLTTQQEQIPVKALIRVCFVCPLDSIEDGEVENWLSFSPDHFLATYQFPSLEVKSWDQRTRLRPDALHVCGTCYQARWEEVNRFTVFSAFAATEPLRTFDPFGGVGAFGLGLSEVGCFKTTHAVEISPSAAKTLAHNSPDTVVYNQCSNEILRYAIKTHQRHPVDAPLSMDGSKTRMPLPPQPGNFECVIAGFPCQTHSRLNMFQKADDSKSHLILNVLSWVDFLKPNFCVFENVRGFLQYNLNAIQESKHKVDGGIDMGGLKFVVRAMLAMQYQVRFGLLQAAHYGTPQARVRFFFIAAKQGLPLPSLPRPTHDFPLVDSLQIKLPNGRTISSFSTVTGNAPHKFVTIDDAIRDLPWFDWKYSNSSNQPPERRREARHRAEVLKIPAFSCEGSRQVGFHGEDTAQYRHQPYTSFQRWCRRKPTSDLQQYTRSMVPKKVDRVINIPLQAGADYRSLQQEDYEWQFANPSSAVGKSGWRPGLYGRLDKEKWFSTTVTNMEPTAKQSRVLNPYCKRMVTVRELARSQGFPDSFVFHSINDDVVTMHRQIGNAVPWPVATAIGREIKAAMFKKWAQDREEAIVVDDA